MAARFADMAALKNAGLSDSHSANGQPLNFWGLHI